MEQQQDLGLTAPTIDRADSSVLGSIARKWLLVVGFAASGLAISLAFALLGPPSYVATTSIVVEVPGPSQIASASGPTDPERYVVDQVEILRSHAVAQRASEKLAESGVGSPVPSALDLSPDEGKLVIASPLNSNVIDISLTDRRAEVAFQGTTAVLEAYQEIRAEEAARSSASALRQLDERISELDDQLAAIASEIRSIIPPEMQDALETQSLAILGRIIELEADLMAATNPEQIAAINSELNALATPINAVQGLIGAFSPANLQGLLDQQTALITRRADLTSQRDTIVINSELTSSGVAFVSPPADPIRADLSVPVAGVLGMMLGLILGAALARWRVLQERRVADHTEPGQILGVPLLADIPLFSLERLDSSLPVRDRSSSVTAESFRFAASSLAVRLRNMDMRCVSIVSGRLGDGKSTVAANLGYAATRLTTQGSRVLLIDGDFATQSLTKTLGMQRNARGLTDAALNKSPLPFSIQEVDSPGPGSLFLLGKGGQPVDPQSFFWSEEANRVFEKVRGDFDLVIVDTPPLLQVAYASTLAGLSDSTVVVTRHGGDSAELSEVRDKLSLVGRHSIGYVYTHAPMRDWMTEDSRSSDETTSTDWSYSISSKRDNSLNDQSREVSDRLRRL